MSHDSVIYAARASLDAYNSKKWDAVCGSITDDCAYDETATHRKVEGIAAVLEFGRDGPLRYLILGLPTKRRMRS